MEWQPVESLDVRLARAIAVVLRDSDLPRDVFLKIGFLAKIQPDEQVQLSEMVVVRLPPPAVSVTDAIARRMVAEYDAVLCGDPTATRTDGMRAALEAALATQEGRNG